MSQRLPIALGQVKAGNTSENLLNEIRQTIYSVYPENEVTKQYDEFNIIIKNNGYYIYEFSE